MSRVVVWETLYHKDIPIVSHVSLSREVYIVLSLIIVAIILLFTGIVLLEKLKNKINFTEKEQEKSGISSE